MEAHSELCIAMIPALEKLHSERPDLFGNKASSGQVPA